jgi:hypothetical protein
VEILDYLRAIGRRFWVLVLVPATAGLLPVTWFLLRPAQYSARATVIPTALVGGGSTNQYRGSEADKQFASNVTAAAKTRQLIDRAAASTSVPSSRIRAGLTISQVKTSAFVELTYLTSRRAEAVPVVRTVAADTLRFLFQGHADAARAQVDAAQKQIDKADTGMQQLTAVTGGQSPQDAYTNLSKGLAAQQAIAARTRDPAAAAQIQRAIEARQAELAALGHQQGEYLALVDTRRRAVNLRAQSQEIEQVAVAQLSAAEPGRALSVGKVHRSFPLKDMLEVGVGAAAGGVFLAVAYVLVREVWDGVRARSRRDAVAATG